MITCWKCPATGRSASLRTPGMSRTPLTRCAPTSSCWWLTRRRTCCHPGPRRDPDRRRSPAGRVHVPGGRSGAARRGRHQDRQELLDFDGRAQRGGPGAMAWPAAALRCRAGAVLRRVSLTPWSVRSPPFRQRRQVQPRRRHGAREIEDEVRPSTTRPRIADQDINHIFDRFYRSDKARNTPGTGLNCPSSRTVNRTAAGWLPYALPAVLFTRGHRHRRRRWRVSLRSALIGRPSLNERPRSGGAALRV